LLAQHPAHGVGHVALTAAVGANQDGDAGFEVKARSVGEALEAGDLEALELHQIASPRSLDS
jgi:hypothetical protein